jgi:two-component system, LytTR family, response regulator
MHTQNVTNMITAIIVDDEIKSAELAELKLKKFCPQVSVLSVFTKPEDALTWLNENKVDVVFSDIEMPSVNGLSMAASIKDDTEIVFITAYEKYSIEAIRLTAFDYLLKPIDGNELIKCVSRLEEKIQGKKKNENSRLINTSFDKMAIASLEGVHFISIKDIVKVEAESNYAVFYFADKRKMTVSKTLKQVEEALQGYTFFRAHKSYLVNLAFISKYIRGEGGTIVLTDGSEVEVSRNKKKEFLELFEGL